MATEVRLPQFGMGMSEATVIRWYKNPGDSVTKGEPLLEVEAAKAINEIPAPLSGVLASIVAPVDTVVPVYKTLGFIAAEGESASDAAEQTIVAGAATHVEGELAVDGRDVSSHGNPDSNATPRARRLARELGLDLSMVAGTGTGGRITDDDVQGSAARQSSSATAAAPPEATELPMTGMRAAIARRMRESLQESAQLTLTRSVDVTELVSKRESLKSEFDVSYNDFLVKAAALALRMHPGLNATCDGRVIRRHPNIDIGIAVALQGGLIVPVVRRADARSIRHLAAEIRRLAELARTGKLATSEVTGSTFCVSNLGALDIDVFTPIVNAPEVAILGIGRIAEQYMMLDEQAQWRRCVTVSLTIDHRAVDGVPGAEFLRSFAALCGAPDELVHGA